MKGDKNGMMKIERKEKTVYLEIIRILACFFVIFNHTCSVYMLGLAPMNATRIFLLIEFFFCKTAVPMFLMVSGACLLGRDETIGKTLKRTGRMLLVLMVMSAIYNMLRQEPLELIEFLEEVFVNPVTNSYWYIYLYIGILLLLPILRKLKLEKKDYIYLTVLYVVLQGTFPILGYYCQWVQPAYELGLPFLSTYVYCFLMGYYFVKVERRFTTQGALIAFAGLLLSIGFSFSFAWMENTKTAMMLFDSIYEKEIYLLTMITTFSLFYLIGYIGNKITSLICKKIITYVGSCTFVIYLFSDMFIYSIPWIEWKGNYFIGVLLQDVWVFVAGLLVASVLRFIPGIRKLLFT